MAGDVKLTSRQLDALAVLDSWRKGMRIPTATLRTDEVSLSVLKSLEEHGLVDSERKPNGLFWRVTDAGRVALRVHQ